MGFQKERFYINPTNPEKKLPSVTTILGILDKPALMYWAVNCCCDYILQNMNVKSSIFDLVEEARKSWRTVQRQALDIGTKTHEAIQVYLETNKEPRIEDQKVLTAFIAFLEWKEKNKLEVIECEKVVFGENYAGTADLICKLSGEITLIDFKTSAKIYEEYIYQVSAYAKAYNYSKLIGNLPVKNIGILRVDKESGYPEYQNYSSGLEKYFQVFSKLVDFYWAKKEMKGGL